MSLVDFAILAVIAAIAGMIGQALAGYDLGGCLISAVVGYIGSLIGYWIAAQFHLPLFFEINVGGHVFPFVWAIIGSLIFALIVGWLRRPQRPIAL